MRRSGKTNILYGLFKSAKQAAFYLDFEDERLIDFKTEDFERLRESILELHPELIGKPYSLLLDEVQIIPGWEKFCRRLVERENVEVIVSGSSSKVIPENIHTELRGRSWGIEVFPFSFAEYLQLKNVDFQDPRIFHGDLSIQLKQRLTEYLQWGGFPEVLLLEDPAAKQKLLQEYMQAMFFKDIVEKYQITNIALLGRLLDKLFTSYSTKMSLLAFYKQYKQSLPFSKDLLYAYYKHLLDSMLIQEIHINTESSYKKNRNPAKHYLVDIGLARRSTANDWGRRLENIVFMELCRRQYAVSYFFETKECDFIATAPDGTVLPLQVTWELNASNREREVEGLTAACQRFDCPEGLLLTQDHPSETTLKNTNIKIMPAWEWLLQTADPR